MKQEIEIMRNAAGCCIVELLLADQWQAAAVLANYWTIDINPIKMGTAERSLILKLYTQLLLKK